MHTIPFDPCRTKTTWPGRIDAHHGRVRAHLLRQWKDREADMVGTVGVHA